MIQLPLISIITPCYNAEKYIAETISSVQNQTFTNWEMIIVDDGSTDQSKAVIDSFLADQRIRYVYQKNGRQGKARNNAIRKAQGKYLAFLDADDLWVPNKLEIQLRRIESERVDLVYTSGKIFTKDWREEDNRLLQCMKGNFSGEEMLNLLIEKNRIPILSVLVRADKVREVGSFSEKKEVQNAEDYQLWLKLADKGCQFAGLDENLFYYRIHEGQSTGGDTYAAFQALEAIFEANISTFTKEQLALKVERVLNRYLIFEIDRGFDQRFNNLLSLYKTRLKKPWKYLKLKVWTLFGVGFFKKMGYRYLNFNYGE